MNDEINDPLMSWAIYIDPDETFKGLVRFDGVGDDGVSLCYADWEVMLDHARTMMATAYTLKHVIHTGDLTLAGEGELTEFDLNDIPPEMYGGVEDIEDFLKGENGEGTD